MFTNIRDTKFLEIANLVTGLIHQFVCKECPAIVTFTNKALIN